MPAPEASGSMSQFAVPLAVVLWALLHACSIPLLRCAVAQCASAESSRRLLDRVAYLAPEAQRYLRRLVRSQMYYVGASVAGAKLLYDSDLHSADDLLHRFGPLHQVAFSAALAHWVVAFFEDASTGDSFKLTQRGAKHAWDGSACLFWLYLAHHVAAGFCFGYCLRTRTLGAIGAIGLLFEAPVAFVNVREVAALLRGCVERRMLEWVWCAAALLVLPCRFGGTALYVHSLVHWRAALGQLHPTTQARASELEAGTLGRMR